MTDILNGARWALHLGDCIEGLAELPDKCVDHVIADPPYSERVHRRLGKEGRSDGVKQRGPIGFSCLTDESAAALAREYVRVARRWVLLCCDELSFGVWVSAVEAAGGEYVRKGTWVKTDAMPQMSGDRPSTGTEELVIAHAPRESGRMRWNGGGKRAVYQGSAQERGISRVHECQKPLWFMRALVDDFTDPGDLILDSHSGSGSTGVACITQGRRFIGWERDPKHHAIASDRIGKAREQLTWRPEKLAPVEQMGLLK